MSTSNILKLIELLDSINKTGTTSEDHKNEGLLKSIWHNLTNHPAHRNNDAEGTGDATTTTKSDGKKTPGEDKKSGGDKKE